MKKFIYIILSFIISSISFYASAETKYVTDDLYTFLRKGAGDQYRISSRVKAGEKVTVLAQRNNYTLIRDDRNREAWILSSELSDTPSSKTENPKLKAQIQELTLKLNNIDNDWKQRTVEIQRRNQQAEEQSSQLLEQNSLLKREIEMTKNKNRDLEALLDAGKREIAIQWFIYGGSVLGIGLLLGLIIPHIIPKRRRRDGWA